MERKFVFFFFAMFLVLVVQGHGQTAVKRKKFVRKNGGTAALQANSAEASSFVWYRDGNVLPGINTSSLSVNEPGIYKVVALNSGDCPSDESVEIEIIIAQPILADVAITKRSEIREVLSNQLFNYTINVRNNGAATANQIKVVDKLPDNLIFESFDTPTDGTANYDVENRTINWTIPQLQNGYFSELIVKVMAKQAGKVSNTANVTAMETDPDLSNNTSTDNKNISAIRVPNVITPNGDGKNDFLIIDNLDSFDENQLTIINRWQSTVYQAINYKNNWDGSKLADGTYFYLLRVRNVKGSWIEQNGYITILR